MSDYIKREDVFEKISHVADMELVYPLRLLRYKIEELPSADVVEVVRCKDCVFWKRYEKLPNQISELRFEGYCDEMINHEMNGNDYCSYGKEQENE